MSKVRLVGERALFELCADRILAVLRAHQDSTGHDGHLRVDIQKVSSAAQRSRLPPCVVIAESDVTRRGVSNPDRPSSSSQVLGQRQYLDSRKLSADRGGGAVAGAVVHHQDLGPFRQPAEMLE
jgi:hypothetical protein